MYTSYEELYEPLYDEYGCEVTPLDEDYDYYSSEDTRTRLLEEYGR